MNKYGLPDCERGNKQQNAIRNDAMRRLNKATKEFNRKREKANELRYYRRNGMATKAQLKKLSYLESMGY